MIEYSTLFILTKEMVKNYIRSHRNKMNKKIITQLALNCAILSIENEQFDDCAFLMKEIEKLLYNELNFYEQTIYLYVSGYFEYMKNISSGKEKMNQALLVFEILNEKRLKEEYEEHYSKIVKD